MKLIVFALAATAGYWLVTKAAPVVQARIEAMTIDAKWDALHDVFPSDEGEAR
jgi:hypothetical protein